MRESSPIVDGVLRIPAGRRIAFTEWGDPAGAPVLFFHGTSHSRLFCPDPAATERAGVRLFCLDRPGIGGSDPYRGHSLSDWARDAVAFADVIGLDRFGVVGWSGGAWYAAALAAVAPERLTGVVLSAGGAGPFGEVPGLVERLSGVQRETLDLVRRLGPIAATEAAHALPSVQEDARPGTLTGLVPGLPPGDRWLLDDAPRRDAFDAASREAFRQGAEGLVEDRVARFSPWGFRVEDIATPVHLFHAAEDAVFPPERGDDWARRIPRARLTVWPDAGHLGIAKHWADVLAAVKPLR